MVVFRKNNLPPNSWRLSRAIKIFPGVDDRIYVAEILTRRGVNICPILKLILLPIES